MKKQKMIQIGVLITLAAFSVSACKGKQAEEPVASAVEETALPEVQETEANASGLEILKFDKIEDLQDAFGFMVLTMPEYWGYDLINMDILEPIASVNYELTGTDKNAVLCTGKASRDITIGIYENMKEVDIEGTTVHVDITPGNDQFGAAWWDDVLSYSIDAQNLTEEEFMQLVQECVGTTNAFPGGVFPTDGGSEVQNPMVEYETWDELEKAAGFKSLSLIAATSYDVTEMYLIGKTVIEIRHVQKEDNNKTFSVRIAKGTDDISGVYGVTYQEKEIAGIKVKAGALDDMKVAIWNDGEYTYAATSEGENDEEIFDSLLESLVTQSKDLQK